MKSCKYALQFNCLSNILHSSDAGIKMGVHWDNTSASEKLRLRREILYNTVVEFGVPVTLVGLIKMYLQPVVKFV
jgi:hypothetical protein